eukprot:2581987-Karenia_brevis.AAC.1
MVQCSMFTCPVRSPATRSHMGFTQKEWRRDDGNVLQWAIGSSNGTRVPKQCVQQANMCNSISVGTCIQANEIVHGLLCSR